MLQLTKSFIVCFRSLETERDGAGNDEIELPEEDEEEPPKKKKKKKKTTKRGALGFSVLRFWPFFRSVFPFFAPKNFGFSILVSVAVCSFSVLEHLFFGFRQKYKPSFGFGIPCGFRFSLIVSGFSSAIDAPQPLRWSPVSDNAWDFDLSLKSTN